VLHGVIGHVREIEEVPSVLVGRLMHYFSTYKLRPESSGSVTVNEPYGRAYAEAVVTAALEDYQHEFPRPDTV